MTDLITQKRLFSPSHFTAKSLCIHNTCLGKPRFYMLPKTYKLGNPGLPTVSARSVLPSTYRKFRQYFLPLVADLPSFLKDTNHPITTFRSIILTLSSQHHIFTLNVTSLYTSIPLNDGLSGLHVFREAPVFMTLQPLVHPYCVTLLHTFISLPPPCFLEQQLVKLGCTWLTHTRLL